MAGLLDYRHPVAVIVSRTGLKHGWLRRPPSTCL